MLSGGSNNFVSFMFFGLYHSAFYRMVNTKPPPHELVFTRWRGKSSARSAAPTQCSRLRVPEVSRVQTSTTPPRRACMGKHRLGWMQRRKGHLWGSPWVTPPCSSRIRPALAIHTHIARTSPVIFSVIRHLSTWTFSLRHRVVVGERGLMQGALFELYSVRWFWQWQL